MPRTYQAVRQAGGLCSREPLPLDKLTFRWGAKVGQKSETFSFDLGGLLEGEDDQHFSKKDEFFFAEVKKYESAYDQGVL